MQQVAVQLLHSRTLAGDWLTPRQPRLARSSTAQTSDRQLHSPGRRPITFTRRRDSPKILDQIAVADPSPVLTRKASSGSPVPSSTRLTVSPMSRSVAGSGRSVRGCSGSARMSPPTPSRLRRCSRSAREAARQWEVSR
jgi:hypothetical protein